MLNDNKTDEKSQTATFSVYVIWCRVTDKYYVGVTRQQVKQRIRQHKKGKQFIDCEIKSLGWENFDWWVVESHVPANLISEREQHWVDFFDCVHPKGYNKTCGGISYITVSDDTCEKIRQRALDRDLSGENNPMYGKQHSDEAKEEIRQARLGKPAWNKGLKCSPHTAEHNAKIAAAEMGEKNHFYGKHHTEEAKERNRQAHLGKPSWNKGVPCREETKTILREKALERDISGENNPFYGKHHTAEAIERSRQANLGRTPWNKGMKGVIHHTDETRAKMREAHLGKTPTAETKAKLSSKKSGENHPMYGKHHSEETREKMRLAHAAKRAAKAAQEAQMTP